MQAHRNLTAGQWVDERTLIADVHGGMVDIITLTEPGETTAEMEDHGVLLRQLRRHREAMQRHLETLRAKAAETPPEAPGGPHPHSQPKPD